MASIEDGPLLSLRWQSSLRREGCALLFPIYSGSRRADVDTQVMMFPVASQDNLIDIAILGPQSVLGALSARLSYQYLKRHHF
jgi:hypothetical protein